MGNRAVSPESATGWLLKLIVWEFFCTLTWSSQARSCGRKRRAHVTRWLRYWARTARPGVADPLAHLAFVVRWERGEIGGLPHCHILISRFPERSINPSTCFAMKNTWKLRHSSPQGTRLAPLAGNPRGDQSTSAYNRFTTEAATFSWPPFELLAFPPRRLD
jgi:hypothetical protein